MKKLLALSVLLVTVTFTQSEAQHFVASYGVQHQWGIPDYVTNVVYNRYHNYDWVHASRVHHGGGHMSFNVLLQRGNTFLEVNVNDFGQAFVMNRYNHYPMGGHVCNDFCGFHEYYYDTYYSICHSHNHHGHNHIAYRPRPAAYVYGYYRTYPQYSYYQAPTTVIYKNAPVKHYKKYKKEYNPKPQYSQDRRPARIQYENQREYPTRRSGNEQPVYVRNEDSRATSSDRTRSSSENRNSSSRRGGRGN